MQLTPGHLFQNVIYYVICLHFGYRLQKNLKDGLIQAKYQDCNVLLILQLYSDLFFAKFEF